MDTYERMDASARQDYLRRISWGAIVAGVFIALVVYLALSILGTAIGAGTINPLQQANPFNGLGTGAGIWFAVQTIVSIAIGGFIAGRSAPDQGGLHGVLSWAATTLVTVYLLASVATSVAGAAAGVVGKGVALAGAGVAAGVSAAAPGVASDVKTQLKESGIDLDWGSLQGQLNTLLAQSGKAALAPANVNGALRATASDAVQTASSAAVAPSDSSNDLSAWFARVKERAQPALNSADTDALANIISARTGKSKAESQQIADNYAQTYQSGIAKYQQLKQAAEQKARAAGDVAAAAVSRAAWGAFILLVIGAVVAYFSGLLGIRNVRGRISVRA